MATTHKGKKVLEAKEPHIEESRKKSLFLNGRKTSPVLRQLYSSLAKFRLDEIVKYSRKNDILPFESPQDIERFCQQNDCSLFAFFSHNKKRPNNLTLGRLFNGQLLEMYELGVFDFVCHPLLPQAAIDSGSIPALLFEGDQWETDFVTLRSVLIDFFVGDLKGHLNLEQVQHALVFTVIEGEQAKILVRHYEINTSGAEPSLKLVTPAFDLIGRRTLLPDSEVMAAALVKPVVGKKKRNIERDGLGRDLGRVFVGSQDIGGLKLKKFAALHKPKKEKHEVPPDPPDDAQ
jgi:ribosome production factor 2